MEGEGVETTGFRVVARADGCDELEDLPLAKGLLPIEGPVLSAALLPPDGLVAMDDEAPDGGVLSGDLTDRLGAGTDRTRS